MRKYIPLFLLAFASFFVYSCDDSNDNVPYEDSDTVAGVTDVYGFARNTDNQYIIRKQISGMKETDMVLVYKKVGSNPTVWEKLSLSYYVSNDPADPRRYEYYFDFAQNDIQIYAEGNYNLATTPDVISNANIFRILVIPANAFKMGNGGAVDFNDYNAVIKYYNIDDSKAKVLK